MFFIYSWNIVKNKENVMGDGISTNFTYGSGAGNGLPQTIRRINPNVHRSLVTDPGSNNDEDQFVQIPGGQTRTKTDDVIDRIVNPGTQVPAQSPPAGPIKNPVDDIIDQIVRPSSSSSGTQRSTGSNEEQDMEKFSKALGKFTKQPDGSYKRDNDTCIYHYQGGTIFRAAGQFTPPGGAAINLDAKTIYFDGDRLKEDAASILPWTKPLLSLKLIPKGDGTYELPGGGNSGRIFLQPNNPTGPLFFEGGTMNGVIIGPATYNSATGKWETATPNDTASLGTIAAAKSRLKPGNKPGEWIAIPDSEGKFATHGTYKINPDGSIDWSGGKDAKGIEYPPTTIKLNTTTDNLEYFVKIGGAEYSLKTRENPAKKGHTQFCAYNGANLFKVFNSETGNWDAPTP